ncbi:hypothetical protein ACIGHN_13240 [Acidovorax sp. NPDC077693]|jgi:hypothetical protein|uniref:Imm32 family immunity protein n=1 Tax=unclassified Acidovorax TaxID=2684926 RepID=UPI0037C932CD
MFGFLKPKKPANQLPSVDAEPERYQGRPLLIILERYVLSCIDQNDDEATMVAIVQKVWGGGQDWKLTVREQLELPETIDEAIRGVWAKNQLIATQKKVSLHPVQFAKMFVDSNFAHLIESTCGAPAEITLCATPGELRRMSEFLVFCAAEMDRMGDDYGHIHLDDRMKEFDGSSPHFVDFRAEVL